MEKVHYSVLEDMEKYNKNFDRKYYENLESEKANEIFKKWYSEHLPVDLLSWCRVNEPSDEMIYKQGYWEQIIFIRDIINLIFYTEYEEYKNNPVMVINTHRTKSIIMPVYEINIKKYGLKMILRDNLYDWKISVISEKEINIDFMKLFNEEEQINSVYCEGFKENQVFQSYKENKNNFTLEIGDKYNLYTFMYILNNYFNK